MTLETRVQAKLAGNDSGIHSVEVAAEILMQLANFRQPVSLKLLSEHCKLSPSKVHRYLTSMTKLGLTFHGHKSGSYSLGKNAISLGLAAMHQVDQIDNVIEDLPHLVSEVKCHIALVVWSRVGPTVIKFERSEEALAMSMMLGQVLPVLHSASGRVFAAFLDSAQTRELIEAERLSYNDSSYQNEEQVRTALNEVRRNQLAISIGEVESETMAISSPVMDWQDNPIVVVTALLSKYSEKERITSIATKLRKFTEEKSVQRPTFPF